MESCGPGSPYREVKSLERGLVLLETLARVGWATPTTLARETGIERSTIYRLMNTLEHLAYVTRRDEDGTFFLTGKVASVGREVEPRDIDIDIISQTLTELVGQIHWPSDFAVLSDAQLTIMASNHRLSSMSSFRGLIGAHRPLLRSALGRALLAAMSPDELEQTLEVVRLANGADAGELADRHKVMLAIEDSRARGYAASDGLIDPKISGIGLAVHRGQCVAGAINIVFYRSAMTCEEAASRYLGRLRLCVEEIEQRIGQSSQPQARLVSTNH